MERTEQLPGQLPADFRDVDVLVNNAGLALGVAGIADLDMAVRTAKPSRTRRAMPDPPWRVAA